MNADKTHPSLALLHRVARTYLRPYTKDIIVSLILMALAAGMTALLAKALEPIINDIFIKHRRDLLLPIGLGVFAAFAIRGFTTYGHTVILNTLGQELVSSIQKDLYAHLLKQDLGFFHRHKIGELLTRLTSDVTLMRVMVSDAITALGKNMVTLVGLVIVMFDQDWRLALAAFVVFPVSAWGVIALGKTLRRVARKTQTQWSSFTSLATEVFQGIRQVKAYGMEQYECNRAIAMMDHLFRLIVRSFKTTALSSPVGELLSAIAIVTVILYGGNRVIQGEATAGGLFSFIMAFILAYEPMKKLATVNAVLQTGMASADRVFSIIDTHPSIVDASSASELTIETPSIRLENVSFAYDSEAALSDVSIDIPAGKKVALVGPSGAGKSTILNLIPRFYDLNEGAVIIDGIDIRTVTLNSLRKTMALVSQDIAIFDDTVAGNIAYGHPEATKQDIINAAIAASAHDFIMALPDGYETQLGEQGLRLSGGQKQRIAIARAMLRNAPILLLDEATSSLDAESERAIGLALAELQKGRTTLVIAHRLSTVMDADLIYVLENGRVAESGTHQELLARQGAYARLYGLQITV